MQQKPYINENTAWHELSSINSSLSQLAMAVGGLWDLIEVALFAPVVILY